MTKVQMVILIMMMMIARRNNEIPKKTCHSRSVAIEMASYKYRIEALRGTGAKIKFLSLEPLLEPLGKLDLKGIDWVIVGGESGPRARMMREEWVVEVKDQCIHAGVPFFFKQWGGVCKKQNGRQFQGRTWDEMPVAKE